MMALEKLTEGLEPIALARREVAPEAAAVDVLGRGHS